MRRAGVLLLTTTMGLVVPGGLVGCASTKIAAWEALGYAKRDQLVSNVKAARDEQSAAKDQFKSALDQLLAMTNAGQDAKLAELESRYRALQSQLDRSESRATAVRSRIADVESVAGALFKEWQAELAQYSSDSMRQASQRQLHDTRAQYERLVSTMKSAAGTMDPVLAAFRDQVLFLKHNLNARAIASLQGTATQVQSDVARLVAEMETSIGEANRFIDQMAGTGPAGTR
jgi:chromosome segregation ATPase